MGEIAEAYDEPGIITLTAKYKGFLFSRKSKDTKGKLYSDETVAFALRISHTLCGVRWRWMKNPPGQSGSLFGEMSNL